jgi:hypothetical protein
MSKLSMISQRLSAYEFYSSASHVYDCFDGQLIPFKPKGYIYIDMEVLGMSRSIKYRSYKLINIYYFSLASRSDVIETDGSLSLTSGFIAKQINMEYNSVFNEPYVNHEKHAVVNGVLKMLICEYYNDTKDSSVQSLACDDYEYRFIDVDFHYEIIWNKLYMWLVRQTNIYKYLYGLIGLGKILILYKEGTFTPKRIVAESLHAKKRYNIAELLVLSFIGL